MRENALRKNALDYIHLAEAALDDRFPSWRSKKTKCGGGKSPTDVMFKGETRHFDSQKDAYIWLIGKFILQYPDPFQRICSETYLIAKGERAFYFHRSIEKLFPREEGRIPGNNKFHLFSNGWYGKLVLSEKQKLQILYGYGLAAHLSPGIDWNWNNQIQSIEKELDDIFGAKNEASLNTSI